MSMFNICTQDKIMQRQTETDIDRDRQRQTKTDIERDREKQKHRQRH